MAATASIGQGSQTAPPAILPLSTSSSPEPEPEPEPDPVHDDEVDDDDDDDREENPPLRMPNPVLTGPLHKRRRVTRACDECRRKKIKCDGKQPCTHCTVYSYDCTYNQPSNRRRNPTPQYIEALENRLQRAETLLRTLLPAADLSDANLEVLLRQTRPVALPKPAPRPDASIIGNTHEPAAKTEQDAQLRSMIESTGQLDIDESGHWDFHGGSSGAVFVRRMGEQFGGLLGTDKTTAFLPRFPRPREITPIFDSPRSTVGSPLDTDDQTTVVLPSREMARELCAASLNVACSIFRFVHQPSFYEMLDRMYDLPPRDFGDDENRFLPLLYTILALGCMFHAEPPNTRHNATQITYTASIEQGLKYFRAARHLMDITNCRDTTSLQAIVFMTLFLQTSANLSTCYSYIGIALRSALRMGFHRNLSGNFNPIERETRKRVFWTVRKMDTYVSALLGFPQMLSYDDIDQELPTETNDEYITREAISPMPEGQTSLYSASNAHTRLMATLAKVVKYIYPTKSLEKPVPGCEPSSYVVSHAKIKEIERDLADWHDKLPMALRPGGDASPDWLRVQQLLRLSYAHVQMMLYRPFLHYASHKQSSGKSVDDRSYACAAAAVSVSRNVVHITIEMEKWGLLIGAHWFTMYTTFFAIISLVYFVLENPNKPGSEETLADAYAGKDALARLARRSQAADRCSTFLRGLFDQLPKKLRKDSYGPPTPAKKKRSAASPNVPASRGARKCLDFPPTLGRRATTFPAPSPAPSEQARGSSLEDIRVPPIATSDPNLRRSYHELMSPMTLSNALTPDSSTSGGIAMNSVSQQPPFPLENPLFDVNAMMFPSTDPFAYPNQPFMPFEDIRSLSGGDGSGQTSMEFSHQDLAPQMFIPNTTPLSSTPNGLDSNGSTRYNYDDLDGKLIGRLPPCFMQGHDHGQGPPQSFYEVQTQSQNQGQLNALGTGVSGIADLRDADAMGVHSGLAPGEGPGMGFEDVFGSGGEEWMKGLEEMGWRQ